jgi:hypothetical protein
VYGVCLPSLFSILSVFGTGELLIEYLRCVRIDTCEKTRKETLPRYERVMNIKLQRKLHVKSIKTAEEHSKDNWLLNLINRHILRKAFRRLCRTAPAQRSAVPTQAQRNLVLTGLILGFISVFAAFFPICGLPIALTGFIIGLYGHRTTSLQMMSSWAIALSLAGLILTFICIIVTISIYFSNYLLLS